MNTTGRTGRRFIFTQEDRETLESIASALERMSKKMDSRQRECECCGINVFVNYTEHKAATQLRDTAKKIRRLRVQTPGADKR